MYYKLCWRTQDGRMDCQKLATTEEKAREWARQNNAIYKDMKHWFELVEYQQNTPWGVMR